MGISLKSGGYVFRGSTPLSLDSKGRLAIPTRYREAFQARADGELVVTADSDDCLLLYAAPDWEPIQRPIMDLPNINPRVRKLQRLLVGRASDVEMDAAGRILMVRETEDAHRWSLPGGWADVGDV